MRSARLAKSIPFVAIAIAAYSCAHGIDNGLNGLDTSGPGGVGVGIGGFGGDHGTMAGPGTGAAGDVTTATRVRSAPRRASEGPADRLHRRRPSAREE